jgi:hypothetical protein
MAVTRRTRQLAVAYLMAQGLGAAVWWAVLLMWPASRSYFRADGAPDSTLLAFGPPDGLLFVATSIACALGIQGERRWAWPLLCVHAGAGAYASLYCWGLVILTGGNAMTAAVMMTPSLIVPGVLAWLLRPKGG